MSLSVREPAVAGQFYEDDPKRLQADIAMFLKSCVKQERKGVKALIVPHAGFIYSGIVAAAGYRLIKNAPFQRVIVLGPSHNLPFRGGAFDTNDAWDTPLGRVPILNFFSNAVALLPQAHQMEHSIEVQVPFLQTVLKEFSLTPIALGGFADTILLDLLATLDEKTLLIVSSDLSHYHPYAMAQRIDKATIGRILSLQEGITYDEACGADGINLLVAVAKKNGWKPHLIDYRNSGDTAGDRREVVGYCCIAFTT